MADFGDLGLGDHHHDGDDAHHEHRRRREADPQEAVEKMVEKAKGKEENTFLIYLRTAVISRRIICKSELRFGPVSDFVGA